MGNLHVTLQPGQWRSGPGLADGDARPDEQAELEVRLIRQSLHHVLDEVDRPTGWVSAQGHWHRDGEVAADLVRLLIRAEALPEGALPEAPGGGDR